MTSRSIPIAPDDCSSSKTMGGESATRGVQEGSLLRTPRCARCSPTRFLPTRGAGTWSRRDRLSGDAAAAVRPVRGRSAARRAATGVHDGIGRETPTSSTDLAFHSTRYSAAGSTPVWRSTGWPIGSYATRSPGCGSVGRGESAAVGRPRARASTPGWKHGIDRRRRRWTGRSSAVADRASRAELGRRGHLGASCAGAGGGDPSDESPARARPLDVRDGSAAWHRMDRSA